VTTNNKIVSQSMDGQGTYSGFKSHVIGVTDSQETEQKTSHRRGLADRKRENEQSIKSASNELSGKKSDKLDGSASGARLVSSGQKEFVTQSNTATTKAFETSGRTFQMAETKVIRSSNLSE